MCVCVLPCMTKRIIYVKLSIVLWYSCMTLCITKIWVNWRIVLSFYTLFLWISLCGNQGRFRPRQRVVTSCQLTFGRGNQEVQLELGRVSTSWQEQLQSKASVWRELNLVDRSNKGLYQRYGRYGISKHIREQALASRSSKCTGAKHSWANNHIYRLRLLRERT
jgi:hypothetical protein